MTEEEKPPHPAPIPDDAMLKMFKEMIMTAPTEEMRLNLTKKLEKLKKKIAENDE
tara:strand:- start:513 stop:677 length:165 start_codon:yes stop_codon:yes gene_type:complete